MIDWFFVIFYLLYGYGYAKRCTLMSMMQKDTVKGTGIIIGFVLHMIILYYGFFMYHWIPTP